MVLRDLWARKIVLHGNWSEILGLDWHIYGIESKAQVANGICVFFVLSLWSIRKSQGKFQVIKF